jgi:hypothetical protein
VTQDPLAVRLAPKQVQEKRHQISVERAVSSPQGEGRESARHHGLRVPRLPAR